MLCGERDETHTERRRHAAGVQGTARQGGQDVRYVQKGQGGRADGRGGHRDGGLRGYAAQAGTGAREIERAAYHGPRLGFRELRLGTRVRAAGQGDQGSAERSPTKIGRKAVRCSSETP